MDLHALFAQMAPGTIATIAGAGYRDGVPAQEADAGWTMGVVRWPNGDLVVADIRGHRIWRIDPAGILHTLAGDGVPGTSGDGGPASAARVYTPHDLCLDAAGNLYFSQLGARDPDARDNLIRRIDFATRIITTVAGCGRIGRGGDGGPALEAEFDTSCGVAVDRAGNLYVCNKWDSNVRRVDAVTGIIETFAGQNTRHYAAEVGRSRPFSGSGYTFGGYHGDGGPAAEAAFHLCEHLALDSKGDLYVCDNSNHRIRKIEMATGIVSTVFGTGAAASTGDGGPATEAATSMPDALCIDVHDNLYVGEAWGCRLRKVDGRTGIVTTLVGTGVPGCSPDGLPGVETQCNAIESGIWADPDGTVFYSDSTGCLRRVDAKTGIVTTVFGGTTDGDGGAATDAYLSCPKGICLGPDGHIYFVEMHSSYVRAIDPETGQIRRVVGSGGRAYGGDHGPALAAYLMHPHDLAVDGAGGLLIADTLNGRVRQVGTDGLIRTIAGTGSPYDRGEGGPAVSASLTSVYSVAYGPEGAVYFGDASGRIRRIEPESGRVRAVVGTGQKGYSGDGGPATAARIGTASALCFDGAGNLYFADYLQHVVRRVNRDGNITTVAGSGRAGYSADGTPARAAQLRRPMGLAVTPSGTLYIADSGNNRVRRVATDGTLQSVAGGEMAGDGGDGGPARQARLNEPHGLCLFGRDILLISDHYNNRIRAVKLA